MATVTALAVIISTMTSSAGGHVPVGARAYAGHFEAARIQMHADREAAARAEAARIQLQTDHEAAAWAESRRIAAVREAEEVAAAYVAQLAAQAEAARMARAAALQQAASAATVRPTSTAGVASAPQIPSAPAVQSLDAALAASHWPAQHWPTVRRIVACESGGQTTAVSPGGHRGLMQVDPRLHGPVPADAVGQLNQGYAVYLKQGWGAWQCY